MTPISGPYPRRLPALVALVIAIAALLVAGCASDTSDASGAATEPGACDVDDVLQLLQSGLPTYDYEPAGSFVDIDARSLVAVHGRVTGAVRAEVNGSDFTELQVADVVEVGGTPRGDLDVVAYGTSWADASTDDPLGDRVDFDGLLFFGLLQPWSGVRGGWNPGIEGLYVTCAADEALRAVIVDGAGSDDPDSVTLAELASLVLTGRTGS